MYALLENRQRRKQKRWVIGLSVVCILAVAIICIAAKKSSDYKKYADKYLKKYNSTDYASKYKKKYGKGTTPSTKGEGSEYASTNPILSYFDIEDGAEVTWAHAVNDKSQLSKVMNDETIMMLEADVILRPNTSTPIMAHPPLTDSDLTLEEFLDTALTGENKKGIKLDFKESEAIEPSMTLLKTVVKDKKKVPPIVLNADILKGPNTEKNVSVDAEVFLNSCRGFKGAILSPGWMTNFTGGNDTGYTTNDTDAMVGLLKNNSIDQRYDVTFPVRASLVALNPKPMHRLLGQFQNKISLTVWTSPKDTYNPKELGFLRLYKKQVFYDLPPGEVAAIKKAGDENGFDWKKFIPSSVPKKDIP